MISKFSDSYFLLNNDLTLIKDSIEIYKTSDLVVYEVMKVVSEIPLFYEDHFKRLKKSLDLANFINYQIDYSEFLSQVKLLCRQNNKYFGNIELCIIKRKESVDTVLGFIPHKYPQPTDYLNGVSVNILDAVRNLPNAKIKHSELKKNANNYLNSNPNINELLLANNDGLLTEGSQSNLFFICENKVYTAPENVILKGITRKYILRVLDSIHVKVVQEMVHKKDIVNADAAFICSTSRGALPIKNIGDVDFNPHHPVIKELLIKYNQFIKNYIVSVEL